MAEIPTAYVKDKPVDYESEIFALLGEGVRVGDYHFAPPSLGVWALWELLDSPIIHGSEDASYGDFLRLLWVNTVRRAAVPHVREWVDVGKPKVGEWSAMDTEVASWAALTLPDEATLDELARLEIIAQIPLCYTGYETIPSTGESTGEWLFAGEAFGAICSQSPAEFDTLIWDVPMTLNGHITAYRAKFNGTKGVSRPKDPEDIVLQLELANEREAKGELHPWQEIDPLNPVFGLTAKQCEFPATVARFEALMKQAKKKANPNATKHRPKK
jgi:hypothetical protein